MFSKTTPSLIPVVAFAFAITSAKAGTVIADFNDLNNGAIQENAGDPLAPTGQPADTGQGFTDAYWLNNTELILAVDGDLSAPAGSNYIAGQTGTGRSLSHTFGTRVRRLQSRTTVALSTGEVWLSALFSINGTDAEGTIALNGLGNTTGGSANQSAGISFGDNGTPGAVGFLLPSEDALANVGDVSQRVDNAVTTDGTAHLIVVKIELADGDDTMTLWLDPIDVTDEASMGAPLLTHTGAYFDTNAISRVGYEAVREDDPALDTNGGLALIDNLKLSDVANAFDVVTKAATSTTPAAELTITSTPTFGDAVETPTSTTGNLSVLNTGDTNPIVIDEIIFGGADAGLFSTDAIFPITLAANGGTADIPVTFNGGGNAGFFTATLELDSDAPNAVPTITLNAAFTQEGISTLVNGDFESDGVTITDWLVSNAGAGAAPASGIAPGSSNAAQLFSGEFIQQSANLTPDFYAEFFFSTQDTQARAFNVLINGPTGQINIRYQGDIQQWNAFDNVNADDSWGSALGLGAITPNATYFMRIVGRNWGTPETTYDLYLSEAGSLSLTRSVKDITRFQNAVPDARARNLRFSTEFGSAPGFLVDDVKLVTGSPPPAESVRIIDFTWDPDQGDFSFSYSAQAGVNYSIRSSNDLVTWLEEDDPTATSSIETYTESGITAPRRYYRVFELP